MAMCRSLLSSSPPKPKTFQGFEEIFTLRIAKIFHSFVPKTKSCKHKKSLDFDAADPQQKQRKREHSTISSPQGCRSVEDSCMPYYFILCKLRRSNSIQIWVSGVVVMSNPESFSNINVLSVFGQLLPHSFVSGLTLYIWLKGRVIC
jgi:hypothetical protein